MNETFAWKVHLIIMEKVSCYPQSGAPIYKNGTILGLGLHVGVTTREQTCPEIRDLSRNKGLFLRYGATGGYGISGRVLLFLDASWYFWTRRGISARVHNERAAGRAGGRGKDGKIIFGHVSGRAGGRTGWQSYFWTRLAISGCVVVFLHAFITRGRPGGRGKDGKTISGHVFGRAGGRTGRQSYFWTRLQQKYFWARLRAGGRTDRLAKLFLDVSWYFCTRS